MNISHLRHSLAHLLAAAVLRLYPDAKPTIGPAIENGFYYDFQFSSPIVADDVKKIEKEMKSILKNWNEVSMREVGADEAKKIFVGNPFKQELVDEIAARGELITLYRWGDFEDLCRGGHVESAASIEPRAFELDKIAGAYWRGNEKNPMLTRIYGIAFETKDELVAYKKMLEEAEKRDHRKLGKELGIFAFDDDVGPGLPLWLPNGAILIEELEALAKKTENVCGYKRVRTPHIAKESMYLKSGHLPYYKESMFSPMDVDGINYYLKAMNCPHHHKIFAAQQRSYRDMPLRLAEYGTCYRYEQSGELFGLMRVRSLQMNDAHIYCAREQFADEFRRVNDMYLAYFKIFGIEKYVMRFSTHDPALLGQKYVNEPELWKQTEDMVRNVLIESKIPYQEVPNEAAFYGPKIDVQVWSAIGREFTLATNQVDFAVPARFELTYTNASGKEETPLCIHRAPLGTHERFIGFLIEHFAGAFPLWLSPDQVTLVPVAERHVDACRMLAMKLRDSGLRVDIDEANETVGKKIRNAEKQKIPYMIVIGDKEAEMSEISVRVRGSQDTVSYNLSDFIDHTKQKIENRALDL